MSFMLIPDMASFGHGQTLQESGGNDEVGPRAVGVWQA